MYAEHITLQLPFFVVIFAGNIIPRIEQTTPHKFLKVAPAIFTRLHHFHQIPDFSMTHRGFLFALYANFFTTYVPIPEEQNISK